MSEGLPLLNRTKRTETPEVSRPWDRQWIELALIVLALLFVLVGFIQLALAEQGEISAAYMRPWIILAVLAFAGWGVLTWRAPTRDPLLFPITVLLCRNIRDPYRWRTWLAQLGLAEPYPPPLNRSLCRNEIGDAPLINEERPGVRGKVAFVDVEDDVVNRIGTFIDQFFRTYPWLGTWVDSRNGQRFNLKVTYDITMEICSGREEEGDQEEDREDQPVEHGEGEDHEPGGPPGPAEDSAAASPGHRPPDGGGEQGSGG